MTRAEANRGAPPSRKLLLLSDLHLGRDHDPITGFDDHRPSPEFDGNFVSLLEHYTAGAPREWRVILDGDFLDFVEVVVRPELDTAFKVAFDVTREEHTLGLGTEPERAKVKLEMIVEYHERFFRALAGFLREGGELVMVRGNHDAEMFWGKVQRELRRRLAQLAFAGQRLELDALLEERSQFQGRIHFVPWCYVEPGRIYVEHGHQYDPYCAFDHQLYPISPLNPRRVDTPIFMFAMRYFVNRLTGFDTHYKDIWTTKDYLRWLRGLGPLGVAKTFWMAGEASARMVHYAGAFWLGRAVGYGDEHDRRLSEEAERFGVPEARLRRVDDLHSTPVNRNLTELMRFLFLDRVLLGLATVFAMTVGLFAFESPLLELLAVLSALGIGWFIHGRMTPRRFLLPGPRQVDAARRIADILGVKLVVMGHSHQRRKTEIGEGRYYVNTGCWLPPVQPLPHGEDEPCTCNLSHLVVEDEMPDLRIFCWVKKVPRGSAPNPSARMSSIDAISPEEYVANVEREGELPSPRAAD